MDHSTTKASVPGLEPLVLSNQRAYDRIEPSRLRSKAGDVKTVLPPSTSLLQALAESLSVNQQPLEPSAS